MAHPSSAPASTPGSGPTKPRKTTSRYRLDPRKRREFPLQLIPQGAEILSRIDRHTCLTTGQVAELLFVDRPGPNGQLRSDDAAHRAASRALEQLWKSELVLRAPVTLVSRRTSHVYPSYVVVLTPKGAEVLGDYYDQIDSKQKVQWTLKVEDLLNFHLPHRIAIYDFYAIAMRACRRQGVHLDIWLDDRTLAAQNGHAIHFINIPDAVMHLESNGHQGLAFIEIDRGRETVSALTSGRRDWRSKVTGFVEYLNKVYAHEAFFSGLPTPTVITVTTNRPRLLALLDATQAAGGDDRFWFTTLDELDPLPNGRDVPVPAYELFWRPIWTAAGSGQQHSLRQLMG